MKKLRAIMEFTLLAGNECDSVTRVVGLIHHTPMDSIINGPPVYKIINTSPCLLPIYFKRKWQHQASQFPKSLPIMEEVLSPHPLSMTVLLLLLSLTYHIVVTVLDSQYAVIKKYVCEHHKNAVSYPEISLFIYDLQKACNLNYLRIVYATGFTRYVTI